jgi:hypothetical protein
MQAEITQAADLARAEARLPRWMAGVAVLGTLALLLAGPGRAAAGFALGAAFAILNYFWLHQAIHTLFGAGQARVPTLVVVKFAARYPLAVLVIYLLYRTGWVPLMPVFAGLFVPVAGVMMEGILQIREGLRET